MSKLPQERPLEKHEMYVPDLAKIGYREGFSVTACLLGLVGATIGGAIGYFIYGWILRNFGLDGLCIPAQMLGLGFGLAARRPHVTYGVICGVLGLGLGILTEWKHASFVADDSLTFFLKNLGQLHIMTLIMIVLGGILAFSIGQGRR